MDDGVSVGSGAVAGSLEGLPAHWYDGQSALRREGFARWDGAGNLVLAQDGEAPVTIALDTLKYREQRRDETIYGMTDEPDFRLVLPTQTAPGLAAKLPQKSDYGAWVDRIGLGRAAAAFAVVSVAAVALFMTAPNWLGPMVPERWERQLGNAMIGDLGNRLCHTPQGDAALAKMLGEVDPGAEKVRAGVANSEMVNAVALPGGQVLLFDGLIQQAESAEELAGVLAHEVGHVRERHVMTALLRQFGLSALASGFGGGFGESAMALAGMSYSRDAEREADEYARAQMARSDISPDGAAEFFRADGGGTRRRRSRCRGRLDRDAPVWRRAREGVSCECEGRRGLPASADRCGIRGAEIHVRG